MTENTYKKISDKIRKYKNGEKIVIGVNSIVTKVIYALYIFELIFLAVNQMMCCVKTVLVTGISFMLLSVFRKACDAPRPYTIYDFEPILQKKKIGNSFPSRHVFSAFVIATAFMPINMILAIVIGILGVVIAIGRVIAGVHFPKDVIAGMLIGVICGIVGNYIFDFFLM